MTGDTPPPGRGDEVAQVGQLRASHEDRDRVVELLRVAAGDGGLTAEELDERLGIALTARTYGQLAALTADLPATAGTAVGVPAPAPKDVVRIDCRAGTARRDGAWVVPRRIEARVEGGSVTLDLTEAAVTYPSLHIDADVYGGSLTLVTKPGIVVDTDDVAVNGGSVKVRAPWGPGVRATLRIDVSGKVTGGTITARQRRRTFWQWLLHRPPPYALPAPPA